MTRKEKRENAAHVARAFVMQARFQAPIRMGVRQ